MAEMFPFLQKLAENNNRPWFEENRPWYNKARAEFEKILESCIEEIGQFEDLGNLKPKETMFRIYRDVRFSKNKAPFKHNFSAMISRDGKRAMTGFAYYLHFQPEESFMAAGVYEPAPDQLARIRQEIDYNADDFRKIIEEPALVARFGEMQGNQLKTAPKGYPKDHPEIGLLRYTQYYFSAPYTETEVLKPDFARKLASDCRQIRPFLEFMNRALD
jgi:uncharacterized protein (TIGR02453 family)